jgi:acyl-coenzyme A thioesterase PaaI-like protein
VTSASAGRQLADRYAPALIASFGSGGSRIEVRATEPGGVAAYRAALRADLAARKSAGTELLRNRHLLFTPPGAAQLLAGQVDSRLLAMLAAVSSQYQFRVTAFSDAAPGAQVPFRQMTISGGRTADLAALAMVRAQNSPYLPAHAAIVRLDTGQIALSIEFAAPSPLGLLTAVLTVQREGTSIAGLACHGHLYVCVRGARPPDGAEARQLRRRL